MENMYEIMDRIKNRNSLIKPSNENNKKENSSGLKKGIILLSLLCTVLSFLINALPHKLIWTLMILIFYFTIPTLMHFIILKIQSVIDKKKINTNN